MRRNLLWWCVAAVLGMAPLANLAGAQGTPATRTESITPRSEPTAVGAGDVDQDADDDALASDRFAADLPGGHDPHMGGHGMGAHLRMGPGGSDRGPGDLRQKLNLTEDQKSRLADIHDRQARRAIPIEADLRIARLDLHKLMSADKPNRQAIDAQIDKMSALQATLKKSHVGAMLEAQAVLTPAQQKIMRDAHGRRMHMMMGRHMGMGHGMDDEMDGLPMEGGTRMRLEP